MTGAVALTAEGFAARLAALGPFEPAPMVAVGVSGGADSLALVLLADGWARARGGRAVGLTVDHGLRAEAAEEAAQVAAWLAAWDIAHHILKITDPPPAGDVQAWARERRHALLRDWCRREGCLHLLLAHHREDQAETLMLRLARGSGVSGLAGMAAVADTADCRLVRPLLDVPRAALRACLRARGQPWIDDPSNADTAYARVRMRRLMPALAGEGADAARLAETAVRLGRARQVVEAAADSLLAAAVEVRPEGFAWLDPQPFERAEDEVALRALAWLVAAIGGKPYGPRADRLERLRQTLGRPATLGRCRFGALRRGRVLVTREARNLPTQKIRAGVDTLWDGRFRLRLAAGVPDLEVGPLGTDGWAEVRNTIEETVVDTVPKGVRATLPALRTCDGVVCVPHLGYVREGSGALDACWFAPKVPAGRGMFLLAAGRSSII